MAMETHSTKRKRVYKRKFDHDLAIEMAEKGFTAGEIRRHLGNVVTTAAIERVINPEAKARMEERTRQFLMTGTCKKCGGERTRYQSGRQRPDSGLCRKCWAQSRQTRFQLDVDENVISVRCTSCKEWFPPERFPKSKSGTRGYHNLCTSCSTKMRTAYRNRHKEPCVICGEPALPPREKGKRYVPFTRCLSCYRDLITGRRAPVDIEIENM